MSRHDIVDRLRAAVDCGGELTRAEIEGRFIEAINAIEFLRSLLEPLEDVGLEDLPPRGSAWPRRS